MNIYLNIYINIYIYNYIYNTPGIYIFHPPTKNLPSERTVSPLNLREKLKEFTQCLGRSRRESPVDSNGGFGGGGLLGCPRKLVNGLYPQYIWSNYSDLTRPHLKWWFSKGHPLISGKSRLVKYYNLARYIPL